MPQLLAFNASTTTGTGTTASGTFGTTPVNGNTLIAILSTNTATTDRATSGTQTGASWTEIPSSSAGQTNINIEAWQASNITGAGTAISFALASSLNWRLTIFEVSGVTTTPLDSGAVIADKNTSGSSPVTKGLTTSTLSNQVEILIFAESCSSSISSTPAIPAGYTSLVSSGGGGAGIQTAVGYRIYADTVAAESVTASAAGSPTLNLCAVLIGLKALPNQFAARNGNSQHNTGSTASITLTMPKTPIKGNTIFVVTESITVAGNVTSVSATNIPFTKDVTESAGAPGMTLWRGGVGTSPGSVITITGTAVEKIAAAQEFYGAQLNGLDKSTSNNGVSNAPSTGTTGATTSADELVIAGLGVATNQTPGTGAGYTSVFNGAGTATALSMAYKIVAATGTQSMTGGLPAPLAWAGVIGTYVQGLPLPGLTISDPIRAGGLIPWRR